MKKQFIILFFSFFLIGYPQNFQYKKVNENLKVNTNVSDSEYSAIKSQFFKNAKSLSSFLPANYDKTGNTDYTELLQKGIDQSTDIIFPDFPVLIAPKGLFLKSNTNILFQKNSKLKVKANDKEFYAALNFENVENINLYFAKLEGERYQHQNNKGEWGMGIYIVHSKNIYIKKPNISKFWGDGIYIGKVEGITSKDITIDGAFIDENRRNGISIISGDNINITNSLIANTYGTSPEYGIDIEPNKPEDIIQNIVLSNNTTFNNNKGGLLFAFDNLQGKKSKDVSVLVSNHTDYYSEKGIEFHIDRGYQKYVSPISGNITIENTVLYYNKIPIINNDSAYSRIKLNLINIKNNNSKISTVKMNNFIKKFEQGTKQTVE